MRRLPGVLLCVAATHAFGRAGRAISDAVDAALADPATRTPDLGGALGTQAFGETVAQALARS